MAGEPNEDDIPADDIDDEPEEVTDDDAPEDDVDDDEDTDDEDSEDDDDDSEEIEHEGARYAVPKALKDAFLRQADYTRKTQEVASRAKELEARDEALKEQAKLAEEDLTDRATMHAIEQEIASYNDVDWNKLRADDPVGYNEHQLRFTQLKQARGEFAEKIKGRADQRTQDAKRDFAKRVEEAQKVIARDIKGWGPDIAKKLTAFAEGQGFSQREMRDMNTSPAMVKALHKAMLYDEGQKTRRRQNQPPPAQALKTVDKGRSRPAGSATPSDKDSIEAWMAKRNRQLAAKARRGGY